MSEKEIEYRLRRQINPTKETNQKNIDWFWDNVNSELLTKILISLRDKRVTRIAIVIPPIPKIFPCRDVSGELKPLRARIKKIPETKYKKEVKLAEIIFIYFYFFCTF